MSASLAPITVMKQAERCLVQSKPASQVPSMRQLHSLLHRADSPCCRESHRLMPPLWPSSVSMQKRGVVYSKLKPKFQGGGSMPAMLAALPSGLASSMHVCNRQDEDANLLQGALQGIP